MKKVRIVSGVLTVLLFVVFYCLSPSKLSPTEQWQKSLAPWFGMPAKVLDLEETTHIYFQDSTTESHYLLELSDAQAETWKSRLRDTGVDTTDGAEGFSIVFLFALNAPDWQTEVSDFKLQRQGDADVAGNAIYALYIEHGDWGFDPSPLLEPAYPEYLTPWSTESAAVMINVVFILPVFISISLMLFIWPSIWQDGLGMMVLKFGSFCSVSSFMIIMLSLYDDSTMHGGFLFFSFVSYTVLTFFMITPLSCLACTLRWLYARCTRQGQSKEKPPSCN